MHLQFIVFNSYINVSYSISVLSTVFRKMSGQMGYQKYELRAAQLSNHNRGAPIGILRDLRLLQDSFSCQDTYYFVPRLELVI